MHLPRAVGGDDHHRRGRRLDGADLRDGDLEIGQDLQQEGLERLVGAIQLVDQQHRRRAVRSTRLQQRAFLQEFGGRRCRAPAPRGRRGAVGLGQPDRHQLAGMVPLIGRGRQVQPVIALQPHQPAAQPGGQHLGDLGLAGAGLALRGRAAGPCASARWTVVASALVGDVAAGGQQALGGLDAGGQVGHRNISARMTQTSPPAEPRTPAGRPKGSHAASRPQRADARTPARRHGPAGRRRARAAGIGRRAGG